jgi:hypothetical protein
MAPDSHTTPHVGSSTPDRWTRWADHAVAHEADDRLRTRVIVILAVVTLACFGAMTVLIA